MAICLHLDGLTEYYIPAQTIVLTALLCLTIKSAINRMSYHPFGKSASLVTDFLDTIYTEAL